MLTTYRNIHRFSNANTRKVWALRTKKVPLEPQMIIDSADQVQSFNYLEPEMIIRHTHQQSLQDIPEMDLLFPFKTMPLNHPDSFKNSAYVHYDYTKNQSNPTNFAYRRGSHRLHAARDLYYEGGESVHAITSGKVINVSPFYWDTWVVDIEHDYQQVAGHNIVVRYGEVNKNNILVATGDRVAKGEKIAEVGLLTKDGRYIKQPSPDKRGMLHLEMYTGEATGRLSSGWVALESMMHATASVYGSGRSFRRRKDLIDPLPLLQTMLTNSKKYGAME